MSVYGKINTNVLTSSGSFVKDDSANVAFYKVDSFNVSTTSAITLEINNEAVTISGNTVIVMPENATIGSDYVIWALPTGTLQATTDFVNAPVANSRKIGGFHYAPGGNATGTTGGDSTPQINEYSFWDLKFRPVNKDPRGMTCVADNFWCDIYLTGNNAVNIQCSSVYNTTIADANSSPIVSTLFGGNGSATYGSYTWYEAMELAMAFGKRCPTQQEFMAAAYGTTEQTSRGSDPVSTILDAPRTSKWGLIQATGNLYIWGKDRGGPTGNPLTESKGTQSTVSNASLFGARWDFSSNSGSRCSGWLLAASCFVSYFGSRFLCDHLILD